MRVQVVDRSGWGKPGGRYPDIKTIEISDRCPVCGGPRGTPEPHTWYEDGETHCCSKWNNPCGHVDNYPAILEEAKEMKEVSKCGL